MPTFELICLANSKKYGGRCVAGLRTDGGGWVRPISAIEQGVLHPRDYRLDDGSETRVLDVVRVGCAAHRPKPHHPEDWVIDGTRWKLISRPAGPEPLQLLRRHLAREGILLENWGDRVPYDAYTIRPAAASLVLVAPEKIEWAIQDEQGKRRMRVRFTLRGTRYDLSLTDPVWEQRLNRLPTGTHKRDAAEGLKPEDELLLTISLGEPFQATPLADACCYKLVAAVIVLPSHNMDRSEKMDRSDGNPKVAVVRAQDPLPAIDLSLYPDPFPDFDHVPTFQQNVKAEVLSAANDRAAVSSLSSPKYSVQTIRQTVPRAYEPWTTDEEAQLLVFFGQGKKIEEIAQELQRQPGAIRSRLKKLADLETDDDSGKAEE